MYKHKIQKEISEEIINEILKFHKSNMLIGEKKIGTLKQINLQLVEHATEKINLHPDAPINYS